MGQNVEAHPMTWKRLMKASLCQPAATVADRAIFRIEVF